MMQIKAVLFDFDGTLTRPGALDFAALRRALDCPSGQPILEYLDALPPKPRTAKRRLLDELEIEAAARSQPNDGAEELLQTLAEHGMPCGIITRNSLASVCRALANFLTVTPASFAVIITRDDPAPPKPLPAGVLAAATRLGVESAEMLVAGDYIYDITAGQQAGCPTVWLRHDRELVFETPPDFIISRLAELPAIIFGE